MRRKAWRTAKRDKRQSIDAICAILARFYCCCTKRNSNRIRRVKYGTTTLIMNHAVNWEAISAIGQMVGALAVVISLIYLARQVGSSARETRITSVRASADRFIRLLQNSQSIQI